MALARALAVEPKVLLLDEPFGALDAKVREELRTWLRRLHDDVHVTTIFVTHDQEEAMDVAEQIIVMNDGRVEQAGGPRDLYEDPASEFVMGFVGPANRLGDAWVRPHDVEVRHEPNGRTTEALIDRIVHLGFEVRVELTLSGGEHFSVQLTRDQLDELELAEGQIVFVRPRAERTFSGVAALGPRGVGGAERAGGPLTGSRRRGRRLPRTPGFCRLAQLPHPRREARPSTMSARVTSSMTSRMFVRSAIHTFCRFAASPSYSSDSGPCPRTVASGPSTARTMSASEISSGALASQ